MKPERRTIIQRNISPAGFNQLYLEHSETLSCPCSKITIPYKDFVINKIRFHPVCRSIFVKQQWIEALYLEDASKYGTGDFRTTAQSQVNQCSLFEGTLLVSNNKFIIRI
jgi:hypothetical protein